MDEQQALLPHENRDRLMREAVREFADHGYAGASTNRIVRRVGVAKGSLFYHFGSKERLYLAVLDASAERLRGAVEVAMHEPPEDPVERIVALARAEFRFYAAHPDLHRLLHRAVTDPDTRDMISERYAESATTQFAASVGGASFAESVDEAAAIAVLAWVVNGFNETFLPTVQATDDAHDLLHRYEAGLRRYLSVVAPCVRGGDATSKGVSL